MSSTISVSRETSVGVFYFVGKGFGSDCRRTRGVAGVKEPGIFFFLLTRDTGFVGVKTSLFVTTYPLLPSR